MAAKKHAKKTTHKKSSNKVHVDSYKVPAHTRSKPKHHKKGKK
jgi:hypothetical protein